MKLELSHDDESTPGGAAQNVQDEDQNVQLLKTSKMSYALALAGDALADAACEPLHRSAIRLRLCLEQCHRQCVTLCIRCDFEMTLFLFLSCCSDLSCSILRLPRTLR